MLVTRSKIDYKKHGKIQFGK